DRAPAPGPPGRAVGAAVPAVAVNGDVDVVVAGSLQRQVLLRLGGREQLRVGAVRLGQAAEGTMVAAGADRPCGLHEADDSHGLPPRFARPGHAATRVNEASTPSRAAHDRA